MNLEAVETLNALSSQLDVKKAENFFASESLTQARKTFSHTLRHKKEGHLSIVKGITTYEGRVFIFTNPVNPAAVNAQDQRHLNSNHDSQKKVLR